MRGGEKVRSLLYKSYSMETNQFAILLSVNGLQNYFGFDISPKENTEADWIYSLEKMKRLDIISAEENKFVFNEPYCSFAGFVSNAEKVVVFRNSFNLNWNYCVYENQSEDVLVCGISEKRKNTVVLTFMKRRDFFDVFLERDFFPDIRSEQDRSIEITPETVRAIEEYEKGNISKSGVIVGVDLFDLTLNKNEKVLLCYQKGNAITYIRNEKEICADIYSRELFIRKVRLMMGVGK